MNDGDKTLVWICIAGVLAVALVCFIFVGPAGCTNSFQSWRASSWGSDWLVVMYAVDGSVIAHWDLKNAAVHSESHSDGIYFPTPHGVVHLSGHYLYVQNPTEEARSMYLKESRK